MIASHELNFGTVIIFKRLYVVFLVVLQVDGLWNFSFSFFLSLYVAIAMTVAIAKSYCLFKVVADVILIALLGCFHSLC